MKITVVISVEKTVSQITPITTTIKTVITYIIHITSHEITAAHITEKVHTIEVAAALITTTTKARRITLLQVATEAQAAEGGESESESTRFQRLLLLRICDHIPSQEQQ